MLKLTIIALFALLVTTKIVKCSDQLTDFAKISKECFDENQVSEQEFKSFYMNGMKPEAATPHIKCQIKCVMEKMKHMKSGNLDINAAVKSWSEVPEFKNNLDSIRKGYELCKTEKGKDDCDTAFKITMCLQKNDVGGDWNV